MKRKNSRNDLRNTTQKRPGRSCAGAFELFFSVVFLSVLLGGVGWGQAQTNLLKLDRPSRYSLGQFFEYTEFGEKTQYVMRNELMVGLYPKLDLKLSFPSVLHQRVRHVLDETNGFDRNVDIYGTGDVSIGLHGTLLRRMKPTGQRVAVIFEVVLPTGVDDKKEFFVRLDRRKQLGSGAFGFRGGFANVIERGRHHLSTSVYYQHWTRHEEIRLGPSLHVDTGYSYRFLPVLKDPSGSELELRGVVEVASSYRWSSLNAAGRWLKDEGPEVWIKPGFEVKPSGGMKILARVSLPICQDREDELGERRWGATFGIQFDF